VLVDERRLFYVAATRARRHLVVTAVDSPDDDGERPSRFLDETGSSVPDRPERPAAVLTAPALAGRLRHALLRDDRRAEERAAAAECLARLAEHLPAARPERWWGMVDWSPGAAPVRPTDQPVALSGSAASAYETCPLAWFLSREARAAAPTTQAQGFGLVLHALARMVADGGVAADTDAVMTRLDEVWGGLGFEAAWYAEAERAAARAAVERFLVQHQRREREVAATEVGFDVGWQGLDPDGRAVAARLRGSMDRVEVDPGGRVHVVDLKTGKTVPTAADIAQHPQLGVYQVAVREGAVPAGARCGGAELWQLRTDRGGGPKVQHQPPLDAGDDWADRLLGRVAGGLLAERFPARRNSGCDRCAFRASCPAQDAGGEVVR
jgi:RecB family exonuclease